MIKAQGNEEIGRVSKAWSPAEAKRYGAPPKMASLFGDEACTDEKRSEDEEKERRRRPGAAAAITSPPSPTRSTAPERQD
ncbi:unnamed protein product [Heligmosomoides polygyrus]|uniref:Uncharacterized protein n=1 Tax=Heligmosomoides polygyrus TaxID=6339 RepID=A0A183GI61_HELPZ|nr:unnamed protein product [Heligmosomoides polygyrus]